MARGVRDIDIGIPDEKTLKDVHEKLGEVESKIKDVKDEVDASNEELKKIRFGTGLILDGEIEEVN